MVNKLLITPDGKLVTASDDKTIRIWNPKTGREERKILGQLGSGSEGQIYAIALSPDGKLLASGGYFMPEDVIRLHDFHSGELLQILKGHENVVYDLAFSPDGRWLASGSYDNTVRLWKRSGSRFTVGPVLRGHENSVYAVRLFEDGGRLCGWSAPPMTTPSASGTQHPDSSLHSGSTMKTRIGSQLDPTGSQVLGMTRRSASGIIR
jgi:WD40 repeat protein